MISFWLSQRLLQLHNYIKQTVIKIMLDKKFGTAEWIFVSSSDSVCLTYIKRWDGTEENLISVIDSGSQADVLPHVSHWFEGSWSRCRALFLFSPPFFCLFSLANLHIIIFLLNPLLFLFLSASLVLQRLPPCHPSLFLLLRHSRGSDTHTRACRGVSFIDVAGVCASGPCQSERCHWRVIVINVGLMFPQWSL